MGLDMYLNKKTYCGFNYDHRLPEDNSVPVTIAEGKFDHIKPKRISSIEEQIGYWRKANAIHAWFVANVQGGVDECQESEVSRDQLKELLTAVETVLQSLIMIDGLVINGYTSGPKTGGEWRAIIEEGQLVLDSSVAEEHLPSASGFFFGGTNYDQWYQADLIKTKEILEECLGCEDTYEITFTYQASW